MRNQQANHFEWPSAMRTIAYSWAGLYVLANIMMVIRGQYDINISLDTMIDIQLIIAAAGLVLALIALYIRYIRKR